MENLIGYMGANKITLLSYCFFNWIWLVYKKKSWRSSTILLLSKLQAILKNGISSPAWNDQMVNLN